MKADAELYTAAKLMLRYEAPALLTSWSTSTGFKQSEKTLSGCELTIITHGHRTFVQNALVAFY